MNEVNPYDQAVRKLARSLHNIWMKMNPIEKSYLTEGGIDDDTDK
ncbi:hypothetical protein C2W58_00949 [Bacillus pumilus]|uniref:Uncharacterized protein n=1 Tax=Bacillus pumilus TaxID=1408 RepID=A0AB34QZ67_BACPU|nr:hypothetical protein B4127_3492 [Bacillus pumilus]RAP08591.1 hypothetical protein C2W58_00949 [Bacillus pumilus]